MRIAIYLKTFKKEHNPVIKNLLDTLKKENAFVVLSESLSEKKSSNYSGFLNDHFNIYKTSSELISYKPDFLISVGGDGTFLETLLLIKDSGIPVLGLNTGKLGFLANNAVNQISQVMTSLLQNHYVIDERSVIKLETDKKLFGDDCFALNDITIHKKDSSSLAAITTYLNGVFFNTYWADGVIVSTPTGSTAYSMSCGGPIVFPQSETFVITPVAPHNLSMRPVVVPEDTAISFTVGGRDKKFLVSLDSRCKIIDKTINIKISRAPFKLKTVRFTDQSFNSIIREKLKWGIDNRNI